MRMVPSNCPPLATYDLLDRNELPSLVPELQVLSQEERPVSGRGVVELIGRKPGDVPWLRIQRPVTDARGRITPLPPSSRPAKLLEVGPNQANKVFGQLCGGH
jgi:hypothetical protein